MKKKDRIYASILKKGVVNISDLNNLSVEILGKEDYGYFYREYLRKMLKEGRLKRIRRSIYFAVPLEWVGQQYAVDKYLVGSKIKERFYLGYHTAMELYGCAYSNFNSCFIVTHHKDRFQDFVFDDIEYNSVITRFPFKHIQQIKYQEQFIAVSDPSRTFVEALDRPHLCGDWEECVKSLQNLPGVEPKDIMDVLELYSKTILRLKCGYVLDFMRKTSPYYRHITENDLDILLPSKKWVPTYIDRGNENIFIKKWGIYVPQELEEIVRGI